MANWADMIPNLPDYRLHDPYNRLIIVRRSDRKKTTLTGVNALEARRRIEIAAIVGLDAVRDLCRIIEAEEAAKYQKRAEPVTEDKLETLMGLIKEAIDHVKPSPQIGDEGGIFLTVRQEGYKAGLEVALEMTRLLKEGS